MLLLIPLSLSSPLLSSLPLAPFFLWAQFLSFLISLVCYGPCADDSDQGAFAAVAPGGLFRRKIASRHPPVVPSALVVVDGFLSLTLLGEYLRVAVCVACSWGTRLAAIAAFRGLAVFRWFFHCAFLPCFGFSILLQSQDANWITCLRWLQ